MPRSNAPGAGSRTPAWAARIPKFGFYECVEIKTVSWNSARGRDFWWHPYDDTLGEAIKASTGLLYGGDGSKVKILRDGGGSLLKTGARTIRGK